MNQPIMYTHITLILSLLILLSLSACDDRSSSKVEVKEELEEAREATTEAEEEAQEAMQAQEQYYAENQEAQIDQLATRLDDIDKRIEDLQESAQTSSNQPAVADMEAAILDLQDEKGKVNERISEVRSTKAKDWSDSYEEIDQAVARIEGEIDKLSQSLESSN